MSKVERQHKLVAMGSRRYGYRNKDQEWKMDKLLI
jgi:hypothetical protein